MDGRFILSVLLSLVIVASTRAAGPDDPAPVPNFAPDASVLFNDPAPPKLDPVIDAQPARGGSYPYSSRGEYAQRPAIDEGNCCAEYFGGFGCLWETYCADRRRGCGAAACGVTGCRPMPVYPSLRCAIGLPGAVNGPRLLTPRTRIHRSGCRVTPCDCGCDTESPAMTRPGEMAPQEVGAPAEPTPAAPDDSIQPAPPPTLDVPDVQEAKSVSSRRNWQYRRASWVTR